MEKTNKMELMRDEIKELEKKAVELKNRISHIGTKPENELIYWKKAVEKMPVSLFIFVSSKFLWCNSYMEQTFGYNITEWQALSTKELSSKFHPDDINKLLNTIEQIERDKERTECELRIKFKNGSWHWMYLSISILDYHNVQNINNSPELSDGIYIHDKISESADNTGSNKIIGALINIDERKAIEAALLQNEEKYRNLVSNLPDMILIHKNLEILFVNKYSLAVTGYSWEEIINKNLLEIVAPEYHEMIKNHILHRISGKIINEYEIDILAKNGTKVPVIVKGSVITLEGEPVIINVLKEISELKKQESLREYTSRFNISQEKERHRISRELHDNILQLLMSALSSIDYFCSKADITRTDETERIRRLINSSINEIRKISHDLHPVILEDLGLKPAIHKMLREFKERKNIEIEMNLEQIPENLPHEINLCIYRFLQDTFLNIGTQANSNNLHVNCDYSDSGIQIRIKNLKKGFDTNEFNEHRINDNNFSFRNIRERIRFLNGNFYLNSTGAEDAELVINIPF